MDVRLYCIIGDAILLFVGIPVLIYVRFFVRKP